MSSLGTFGSTGSKTIKLIVAQPLLLLQNCGWPAKEKYTGSHHVISLHGAYGKALVYVECVICTWENAPSFPKTMALTSSPLPAASWEIPEDWGDVPGEKAQRGCDATPTEAAISSQGY